MTGKQRINWTLRGYADRTQGTTGRREPRFDGMSPEAWREAEDAYAAGTRSAAMDGRR